MTIFSMFGRGAAVSRGFQVHLADDGFSLSRNGQVCLRRFYPGLDGGAEARRFLWREALAWLGELGAR
jgi:hypothetical protein